MSEAFDGETTRRDSCNPLDYFTETTKSDMMQAAKDAAFSEIAYFGLGILKQKEAEVTTHPAFWDDMNDADRAYILDTADVEFGDWAYNFFVETLTEHIKKDGFVLECLENNKCPPPENTKKTFPKDDKESSRNHYVYDSNGRVKKHNLIRYACSVEFLDGHFVLNYVVAHWRPKFEFENSEYEFENWLRTSTIELDVTKDGSNNFSKQAMQNFMQSVIQNAVKDKIENCYRNECGLDTKVR